MKIARVIDNNLCLGCGLCEALSSRYNCIMKIDGCGFYKPVFKKKIKPEIERILTQCCPSIHVSAPRHNGTWGNLVSIHEAWASDSTIRFKAASGGATTALALYMLNAKIVDAILQVGVADTSYIINELKVSVNADEVINNAQSRYAPALVFNRIKDILDNTNHSFAFIGKPCDIAGIKNFLQVFPQYENRFKFFISIFCAGMPSYEATKKVWQMSGETSEPDYLTYRGNGWPGFFTARWKNGNTFKLSYNDSWGKVLGRNLGLRCKICPDGIGLLADVSIGDYWNTKDGYPDFSEGEGKCFVMIRTKRGQDIFNEALKFGFVNGREIDTNGIDKIQAYQYQRRKLTMWRLIPVQIKTRFLLKFKGLDIIRLGLSANWITGLKNLVGTWRRIKNK